MNLKEFKKIGSPPKLQSEYVPRGEKDTKVKENQYAFWRKVLLSVRGRS